MAIKHRHFILTFLSWILILQGVTCQVLTPPYFNLAATNLVPKNRRITATSTCGEDDFGQPLTSPELFCKLTGANPDKYQPYQARYTPNVIQGQLCAFCNALESENAHPPEQAIDGTERWWQSPPLSRGMQYNEVNLTINLGQEFHVAYVFIKMANSPRPGIFILERSRDYGKTWQPWQYFADTPSDCNTYFGVVADQPIRTDNSVICTTEYSKVVPLENGEIVVSLVNGRPNANNFTFASALQEWTTATTVRLRLLRTKTLLGHLMAVARQDPTVTRRYFYSIKDISIGGRCVCNGHAATCDKTSPVEPYKLLCRCEHNTCGSQCEKCCPNFVQKKWRKATESSINACEPCQCYGHSEECIYDEEVDENRQSIDIHGNYDGGGVCQNCRHNTMGINCNQCRPGFFRPTGVPLNATDACQPCRCNPSFSNGLCEEGTGRCQCRAEYAGINCDRCADGYYGYPKCIPCECNYNGTQNRVCEVGGGQCPCLPNYYGRTCDRCRNGFYGFPDCKDCGCNLYGSLSSTCDSQTGVCTCQNNFGGRRCDECANGYYNFPTCAYCNCDATGSTTEQCDKSTGQCLCKPNFAGDRCQQCAPGYHQYPDCIPCECSQPGSQREDCDNDGQCICKPNFGGKKCERCAHGYYKYPECLPCACDRYGSLAASCDQTTGECSCRNNFEGRMCEKCKEGFYNYPVCEECNCNPAGAKEVAGYPLGGCGSQDNGQLCECKDRVGGHICDVCKPTFWNLNINNPYGCEDCNCYGPGTVGGTRVCDVISGQCHCKPYVSSRKCDSCVDGTYNLQEYNLFGCQDCECDYGGAFDNRCDKKSGQCVCRPRVTGRKCDHPLVDHFVPTLYHHMYEMEDGHTPDGGAVRFGFDGNLFPEFSWKGYATYNRIQDTVELDLNIEKTSLYRIIFRYVNRNAGSVNGRVILTPESSSQTEQSSDVIFAPSVQPKRVTVAGSGIVKAFYLEPGRWKLSLKSPDDLFVDYVVLLPQAYYEATILQKKILNPCKVPAGNDLCKHFVYINIPSDLITYGENGFIRSGENQRERTQMYPDREISKELDVNNMAYLNYKQPSVILHVRVGKPGKYVLILQYHSNTVKGRSQELSVDVTTQEGRDEGRVMLPECPYTSLCRQIFTTTKGDLGVYDINGGYATVELKGDANIDVAIHSVIAIPYDEWNLEMVSPKFQCVKSDKSCVDSRFSTPSGSVKVEIESGDNKDQVSTDVPPSITDTTVKVIKLDAQAPTVNVDVKVTQGGKHAFVVHYYQPYHPVFEVDVLVDSEGKSYKGTFESSFCPSNSGCRSVVQFVDSVQPNMIDVTGDVSVAFNNTAGKPVWIDYIIIVPSEQFKPEILEVEPIDRAGQFISQCGQNEFYIDSNAKGFCRDSVFSLTTELNNGAVHCECNIDGSLSFSCDKVAGQCRCRPNVIGRTCSQCRTGYYGFPRCRPCRCPSRLCHPVTGQCVCPPRVTGANCNTCLPRTFGYDPLIGCEECNCAAQGVRDNNLDCNINTGQCSCKDNIGGRKCDKCLAGYYSFPHCEQCRCDTRGTTEEICDQATAECLCKRNVEGQQCQLCKANTFHLETRNPHGCTRCYCFDATDQCASSNLYRTKVVDMRGWGVTNLNEPKMTLRGSTIIVSVKPNELENIEEPVYWVAPFPYLGNKVTSYGGTLSYTVLFRFPSSGSVGSVGIIKPDLRIEGNNFTIVHTSFNQPSAGVPTQIEIDMIESNFVHESTGDQVTREQFMKLLSRIQAMQVRASYYTLIDMASLSDFSIDVATESGSGERALNVEQCQCPPNYKGTSCEECAEGYYRSQTGLCVKCQCNNRADTCDPYTGKCVNCQDNYDGPQCLTCRPGYYTDPQDGSCKICSCPLPIPSNNFATGCTVLDDGLVLKCDCLPGYAGRKCDACEIGYYGNPNEEGGKCEKCPCNGNIDLSDPNSCDPLSGECRECINYSNGTNCERCQNWYYGDAVYAKNCAECTCNKTGSVKCDHRNGACLCKLGVVGDKCDQCAPQTYGFESGDGCHSCDCGRGAVDNDCDPRTGQCRCKPGVTGRRCDQCKRGYWNLGLTGCQKCQCEFDGAVTCDQLTGQCTCLPGVTGPKCDQCLDRWVMIPDVGCQECDSCIHLLLDDMEILDFNISVIRRDLESVSVGVRAIQRLNRINDTVYELKPKVKDLIRDPSSISVKPLNEELKEVQDLAKTLEQKAMKSVSLAESTKKETDNTKSESEKIEDLVRMATDAANEAVDYAKGVLEEILSKIKIKNLDELLKVAEAILAEIKARDFSDADKNAADELEKAKQALEKAKSLLKKAMDQQEKVKVIEEKVKDFESKLEDLRNNSRHSLDTSRAALDVIKYSQEANIKGKIEEINNIAANIRGVLAMSNDLLEDARKFLAEAREAYKVDGTEIELSKLDQAVQDLKAEVDKLAEKNKELGPLVDRASEHARKLREQAKLLDSLIADTRESAEGAVNASKAYASIISAINEAMNSSRDALDNAMKAVDISSGLAERARKSKEKSLKLQGKAADTKKTVEDLKPKFDSAKTKVGTLEDLNEQTESGLQMVTAGLDMLPIGGYGKEAREAATRAQEAEATARGAELKIKAILEKLPLDEEKVNQIPLDIATANNDIDLANSQVRKVLDFIPDANALLDKLSVKARRIEKIGKSLTYNITELQDRIGIAREKASQITVGCRFSLDTSLRLRNPPNLKDSGSHNQLSLFFRTNQSDGFLAYIGPHQERKVGTGDYLALELVGGKVVFTYDLGTGPARIVSSKVVNDDQWHQIIAERTGKTGTLTIKTPKEDDVVNGEGITSEGHMTVMDFDPPTTYFLVGGVADNMVLPTPILSRRFVGCIEDVKFEDVPVGLWDFVEGKHNNKGCKERDAFDTPKTNGFRFNGNGFVVLDKKNSIGPSGTMTNVLLNFKTFAKNGLMVLMGDGRDFLSLELKDGRLLFQYDLGTGRTQIESQERYNDGKWHEVLARRVRVDGQLKVDGVTVAINKSPGGLDSLGMTDDIYIGGYKGQIPYRGVSDKGFEGCIRDITIGSTARDINDNKFAKGVIPGCPTYARIISLDSAEGLPSHIAMPSVNIDRNFQSTLKIKTENKDGLLLFASNKDQTNAFSLAIVEGKVVATSDAGGESRVVVQSEKNTYNDGKWHYITVTKEGLGLRLDIDDVEIRSSTAPGRRRKMTTTTPLYFGGVPPSFTIVDKSITPIRFVGCIGDVTVNGKFINFALSDPRQRAGVSLGSCPIEEPEVPTLPPTGILPPAIVTRPPGPADKCYLPLIPKGGDEPDGGIGGTRFGAQPESRLEYKAAPDTYRIRSTFSVEFKTTSSSGVMFYVADDRQVDHIALYMSEGRVVYSFDCGSGKATITTPYQYNNGRWHKVEFIREQRNGRLLIDGAEFGSALSPGSTKSINITPPFYVGGLSKEAAKSAKSVIGDAANFGFVGCLRNLMLNDKDFGEPEKEYFTKPCSQFVESGSFISATGGYVKLYDNYKVGLDRDIYIEVKPRKMDGVILSVASQRTDYLNLQMVDGEVIFSVDNGAGEIMAKYTPPIKNSLCDGGWHTIEAKKSKNVVTLKVDGVLTHPGIGDSGVTSSDTNDPLYIGGVPDPATQKGLKTAIQFVGCIRNVQLNQETQNLAEADKYGEVSLSSCPTN